MDISPLANRAQEALETAAQTRAEAGQGDVQAKTKLAQMIKLQPQAQAPAINAATAAADSAASAAPSIPPPPTGAVLNVKG
jgi:hypothetical protein